MVSDSDMGMEGGNTEEEESQGSEMNEEKSSGSSYGMEEEKGTGQGAAGEEAPAAETAAKPSRSGGRRAALKIIRQNVEGVSRDLANFRKTHEGSSKRLEKQVASLRNDMDALKSYLSKENAKARQKQDAAFARLAAKIDASKPAKKVAALKKKVPKPKPKSNGKK